MRTNLIIIFSIVILAIYNPTKAESKESSSSEEDNFIAFQFAVYLLPDCGKNPLTTATKLAKEKLPSFSLIDEPQSTYKSPALKIGVIDNVKEEYSPPDIESLTYSGFGINAEQAKKLQETNHAIILNYAYPTEYVFEGMQQAIVFAEQLAKTCNGLIWDETTREVYSTEYWHSKRVETWKDGFNIKNHVVIHAYQNDEFVRAVTLGMGKFNLPDIAVNNFLWSSQNQVGNLINAVAQSFIEGNSFDDNWVLTININNIKNKDIRESLQRAINEKSASDLKIPLKIATREEGDANNYLLEINFDPLEGKTLQEKQEKMIATIFGTKDKIVYTTHNKEIQEASKRAKKKIPQLKTDFNKGLKPGEFIHIKVPFAIDDERNEWMWVEVITWKDNKIKGILQNDAFNIPDLKVGAEVSVDEDKIFDYIRNFPDGTSEGNETGELILKYQAQ